MLTLTQTLLIIVIVVLTSLLTVVGIQLVFILKEVRKTLVHINQVLDQADHAISRITAPAQTLLHMVDGLKQGAKLVELIAKRLPEKK